MISREIHRAGAGTTHCSSLLTLSSSQRWDSGRTWLKRLETELGLVVEELTSHLGSHESAFALES